MNYEDLLNKFGRKAPRLRTHPRDLEHQLQAACVHWFRWRFPQYERLLFAIPNGGRRDVITGARLKAEGVMAGVADLQLAVPAQNYHGLFIEMKTDTGRQTVAQKNFAAAVLEKGYLYTVCRSQEEFETTIKNYLQCKAVGLR